MVFYYFVPGMLKQFDTDAVISLAAPRPILFLTGDSDAGSPIAGIHAIENNARKAYGLHGCEENLISKASSTPASAILLNTCPRCGTKMLSWMDKNLKDSH